MKEEIKNAIQGFEWGAPIGVFGRIEKALKENEVPLFIFEEVSKMSSIVVAITSERLLVVTPWPLFSQSSVKQLPYEKISKVVFYRRSFYNTLEIEYPGGKIVTTGKEWIKRAAKTLYAKAKELSLEHIEFIQMDTRPTAFKGGSFKDFFKNLFRIPSTR